MSDNKRVLIFTGPRSTVDIAVLTKACETYFPKMDVSVVDLYESNNPLKALSQVTESDLSKIVIVNSRSIHSEANTEINVLTSMIRNVRKDIFVVSIRDIPSEDASSMYLKGLSICKSTSSNLVVATTAGMNMVIAPEESLYHVGTDMMNAINGALEMAWLRSHLTFTQSTVIEGDLIPWNDPLVPSALRTVINYCIEQHAYKPFNGVTAGHFAVKLNDTTFLTSIRKTNYNKLQEIGLVKIVTDGPDTVLAFGAKPSVGGQSQRIVFRDHPEYDCICHFHCPIKEGSEVPVMSQREFECGSHECGQNTSNGLKKFGDLSATHLDNHGPNIVFNSKIDPQKVIDFINANWDLSKKTGGYVSTSE